MTNDRETSRGAGRDRSADKVTFETVDPPQSAGGVLLALWGATTVVRLAS